MDPVAIVVASQRSTSHARSALPGAPVLDKPVASRSIRPKRVAATLLRRFAARLDPSYQRESPRTQPCPGSLASVSDR